MGEELMRALCKEADLGWVGKPGRFSPEAFFSVFNEYFNEMNRQDKQQGPLSSGITASWFQLCQMLREDCGIQSQTVGRIRSKRKDDGHAIVINSFGMDTHRI